MIKHKNASSKIKIGELELKSNVVVAPMAGITDTVLRKLVREYSPNCLLTTEMLSSEALVNKPYGTILEYSEVEHPLSFQIVGHKPDIMLKAAKIVENKADIIDINMGCPVNKVVKGTDGCALMRNPELAATLVKTLKDNISKPITVKFRLGINQESKNYIEFGQLMQSSGADAITIHGRTRVQMYSGEADWLAIAELKKNVDIPVFANGDIVDIESAIECQNITNADGLAIARGILGNPFLINQIERYFLTGEIVPELSFYEKMQLLKKHLNEEIALRGENVGIKFFRKFYSYYIKGINGASGIRNLLVTEENYDKIISVIDEISTYECKKDV